MRTQLRVLVAAGAASIGSLLVVAPALAGNITTPSTNPFTVPGDTTGAPQAFTVTGSGFTAGQQIYVEQCDGVAPTTPGYQVTTHCDLGSSPSAAIADSSGNVTFPAADPNLGFTPFKGVSPQGQFNCLAPNDATPSNGLSSYRNCQLRLSSNNTATTGDQAFITMTLPDAATPPPATPEAPYAVLLPLGAVAVGGGLYLNRRRAARHAA
ncbi:MAG: hypothetical protein JWN46_2237 [Acidimicrobiales bacterium]|nr:hypothetical protein [Acidimicrobiales bacterium]